jgi:hypothetical protein
MRTYGGVEIYIHTFLAMVLLEVNGHRHALAALWLEDQIPDSCCRKIVPEVVRKNTCHLEITVLRNAEASSLEGYQRFGGPCCFHFYCRIVI